MIFAINDDLAPEVADKYRVSDFPTFLHILPNHDCEYIDLLSTEDNHLDYEIVLDWMLKRIEG